MDQIKAITNGFIDFEGQRLAKTLTTLVLGFAGVVAFLVGGLAGHLKYTVYVGLGGTALAFLAVVPPWPIYNQNALPWLPVAAAGSEGDDGELETKGVK